MMISNEEHSRRKRVLEGFIHDLAKAGLESAYEKGVMSREEAEAEARSALIEIDFDALTVKDAVSTVVAELEPGK